MISRNGVHRVVNNDLEQDGRNANRDYFIERRYPEGSTFLNLEKLKKTGRSLREDAKRNNRQELKREFLDIGEIG